MLFPYGGQMLQCSLERGGHYASNDGPDLAAAPESLDALAEYPKRLTYSARVIRHTASGSSASPAG